MVTLLLMGIAADVADDGVATVSCPPSCFVLYDGCLLMASD